MLTVRLTIRELPPDHETIEGWNKVSEMPTREIAVSGEDYHAALAECRSQVPEGWRSIYVKVDR